MKSLQDLQKNFTESTSIYDRSLLAVLFFIWGILTQLNDILVPTLFKFGLSFKESILLQFTFFATYLVAAYPASKLIDRLGYKTGIIVGLLLAALGCLIFYLATISKTFSTFLGALFLIAVGITTMQIAANGYVVLQSKPRNAASNLSFMQSLNSFGVLLTVFFGGVVVYSLSNITTDQMLFLSPGEYRNAQADLLKMPYLIMSVLVTIVALLFYFSKLPEFKTGELPVLVKQKGKIFDKVLQIPHLVWAAIAIFCYVGAEVSIGTFLTRYLALPEVMGGGYTEERGFEMLHYYWGSALVGRVIGGFILRDMSPRKVLAGFAASAAFFLCVSIFSSGDLAVVSLIAVGFFNSILFPTIFTLGINGLGHFAEEGASVLIASIVGGAIIPLFVISLSEMVGLRLALLLPALCYLYIIYFGLKGSVFQTASEDEVVK